MNATHRLPMCPLVTPRRNILELCRQGRRRGHARMRRAELLPLLVSETTSWATVLGECAKRMADVLRSERKRSRSSLTCTPGHMVHGCSRISEVSPQLEPCQDLRPLKGQPDFIGWMYECIAFSFAKLTHIWLRLAPPSDLDNWCSFRLS